jgi:hypothetical protein
MPHIVDCIIMQISVVDRAAFRLKSYSSNANFAYWRGREGKGREGKGREGKG